MNNLTPKADFISLDRKAADAHQEMAMSPAFRKACGIALLQYTTELSTTSLQSAAETAYKMEGARGFIRVLLNLGEKETEKPIAEDQQLHPV